MTQFQIFALMSTMFLAVVGLGAWVGLRDEERPPEKLPAALLAALTSMIVTLALAGISVLMWQFAGELAP